MATFSCSKTELMVLICKAKIWYFRKQWSAEFCLFLDMQLVAPQGWCWILVMECLIQYLSMKALRCRILSWEQILLAGQLCSGYEGFAMLHSIMRTDIAGRSVLFCLWRLCYAAFYHENRYCWQVSCVLFMKALLCCILSWEQMLLAGQLCSVYEGFAMLHSIMRTDIAGRSVVL